MLLNDDDSFQFISQLPIISSCPFGYFVERKNYRRLSTRKVKMTTLLGIVIMGASILWAVRHPKDKQN